MAKKRATKPLPLEELFPEQDTPVIREVIDNPDIDGTTEDAVFDLLGVAPVARTKEVVIPQEPDPPSSPGLDSYLRDQVLQEMYGKTNPSDYDKILLAIKRRL